MPEKSSGKWLIAATIIALCAAAAAFVLLFLQMRNAGDTATSADQHQPPVFPHMQLQSQYAGPSRAR